jgi:hypothetical protein
MQPGATKDFSLSFKPENQSISLNIDNFLGQITMDWEVCGLTFMCLWGSALVRLQNSGFHLSGDLDISPVAHKNGKNLPKMHLDNFNAKLTEDDLQITIFNSMNGSIIGLGVEILQTILMPVVMSAVNKGVPAAWNAAFDDIMESYGGVIPMGVNDLALDLSYSDSPVVTTEHLQLFLNANLMNLVTGQKVPIGTQPDMKINKDSTASLQFGLSDEAINSGSELLFQSGAFNFQIPASLDMATFNTTAFADTIPNLAKTFGDNKPIDMNFSLISAPKIEFKDASFTENARTVGKANFDVLWSVEGKPAFTLRTKDAQFGASVAI